MNPELDITDEDVKQAEKEWRARHGDETPAEKFWKSLPPIPEIKTPLVPDLPPQPSIWWKLAQATAALLVIGLTCAAGLSSLHYQEQLNELRERLGLNQYVRFSLDDPAHPSTDPERALPVVVAGKSLYVKGHIRTESMQAIRVRWRLSAERKAGQPEGQLEEVIPQGGGFVPFDILVPLPLDGLLRVVEIELVPRETVQSEFAGRILTYRVQVKCLQTGLVAYVTESSGWPLPGNPSSLQVEQYYTPTGLIGDVGDVTSAHGQEGSVRFSYEAQGRGPHEWEYKYTDGKKNESPAKFAGCVWLHRGNWGLEDAGWDLRSLRPTRIVWEARSISRPVTVQFFLGTDAWVWQPDEHGTMTRQTPPWPDSLRQTVLGRFDLTEKWQTFEVPLDFADQDERLQRVLGGFGWLVLPGELNSQKYEFEVRAIRLER